MFVENTPYTIKTVQFKMYFSVFCKKPSSLFESPRLFKLPIHEIFLFGILCLILYKVSKLLVLDVFFLDENNCAKRLNFLGFGVFKLPMFFTKKMLLIENPGENWYQTICQRPPFSNIFM